MKPRAVLTGILLTLLGVLVPCASASARGTPAQDGQDGIEVTVDENRADTAVGDRLNIRSTITNRGSTPTGPLVAHLNVATLDRDVYVDLEDWTARPTLELDSLAAGAGTPVSWDVQTVNAGRFKVYAVVLPKDDHRIMGTTSARTNSLVVSPPVHVTVAGRRTLNAGGALPVALAVPLLLGLLLAAGTRYRLRRTA
jgi:hypothetical protein